MMKSRKGRSSSSSTIKASDRYQLLQEHVQRLQHYLHAKSKGGKPMSSHQQQSGPVQQQIIAQWYSEEIPQSTGSKWWNDASELQSLLSGVLKSVNDKLPADSKTGKLVRYCNEHLPKRQLERLDDMDTKQILNICRRHFICRALREATGYQSEAQKKKGKKSKDAVFQSPRKIIMKLIVVGPAQVGKTSCIRKYVRDEFHSSYRTTIGVDFFLKEVADYRSHDIHIHLWDIAGQERFGNMSRTFYSEAVGAIVIADCTSPQSLREALLWKKDIDSKVCVHNAATGEDLAVPCILFLNKDDLLQDANDALEPTVPEEMVQHLDGICSKNGFLQWISTSAKTGHNIEKGVMTVVDHIFDSGLMQLPSSPVRQESVRLRGDHGRSLMYMNSEGTIRRESDASEEFSDDEFSNGDGDDDYASRGRCCG